MKEQNQFNFVDMHCHILPAVDDGSKDMDMSLQMARIASANGIKTIIVTPHYNAAHGSVSPDGIRKRVDLLQKHCSEEGLGISFYPGNELFYDSSLPEKLSKGEVLTLADSRYCLVEFNPMDDYRYIFDGLRALIYEGFRPILAHCERYACLLKQFSFVEEILDQRVLLQVNAASVEPKLFQPMPKFVNKLLHQEYVSFVATDAHRAEGSRSPNIESAVSYLKRKYDARYIRRILAENALSLIRDEEV